MAKKKKVRRVVKAAPKKEIRERGRPKKMETPVSRSILLDEQEWDRIEEFAPLVSYSDKMRAVMKAAGVL